MANEDTPKVPAKRGRPRKATPAPAQEKALGAEEQAQGRLQPENPISPDTGEYIGR